MLEGNSVWPENPLFHYVPQKLLEDTTFTKEARNALVMVVPASLGCSVETVLWQLALMAVLLLSSISLTGKAVERGSVETHNYKPQNRSDSISGQQDQSDSVY